MHGTTRTITGTLRQFRGLAFRPGSLRVARISQLHRNCTVIHPVELASLEEVGDAISPNEHGLDVVWNSIPGIADLARISNVDSLSRLIIPVIIFAGKQVHSPVASPNECSVDFSDVIAQSTEFIVDGSLLYQSGVLDIIECEITCCLEEHDMIVFVDVYGVGSVDSWEQGLQLHRPFYDT